MCIRDRLKAAHVGVAMGQRGTQVAREAADMVVTDDDFGSIVDGVRMGRRIFDNLRRATAYIVAVHVPVSGLALLPVLTGSPLVLLPLHIIFLELIIDPTSSLVFESEPAERDVMRRPPRPKAAALLPRSLMALALGQGVSVLAAGVGVWLWARQAAASPDAVRTWVFCCLVSGNLGLIMVNRSFRTTFAGTLGTRNVPLWGMLVGASAVLALVLAVPAARQLMHFTTVESVPLAVSLLVGLLSLAWFELLKRLRPGALE